MFCINLFTLKITTNEFFFFQWMELFKSQMLPETDAGYQVVETIVGHLSESNKDIPQVSALKWVIHVVDEPAVNAFVLPVSCTPHKKLIVLKQHLMCLLLNFYSLCLQNGQVFVFTGLLNAVSDIHQLSFILGHEIAHAVLEHAVSL